MINNDGGYYAIKGFLYQFDKNIIEIFNNPSEKIHFESTQDINYQDHVIQVKHKEAKSYSLSKIKKPVIQLFDLFLTDKSKKHRLYCHFKDKTSSELKLTIKNLNKLLAEEKNNYLDGVKNKFIDNFIIQFSDNYEKQFSKLINLIIQNYSISQDKAYIYHSIIQSRLLNLSIKEKDKRCISKDSIDAFIQDREQCIFYDSYSKYLDSNKYEKIIKNDYFTFKSTNINNFERLFIIHCNSATDKHCLFKLANSLANKFFKPKKSPQPYIYFHGIDEGILNELKRELIDQELNFNDGTCFNGDRFRIDKLIQKQPENKNIKIKFINDENFHETLTNKKFQEVYQFYFKTPLEINVDAKNIKIQINTTDQILNMI